MSLSTYILMVGAYFIALILRSDVSYRFKIASRDDIYACGRRSYFLATNIVLWLRNIYQFGILCCWIMYFRVQICSNITTNTGKLQIWMINHALFYNKVRKPDVYFLSDKLIERESNKKWKKNEWTNKWD